MILIASNSKDKSAKSVAEKLAAYKVDYLVYNCDEVAKASKDFSITFTGGGNVELSYNGRNIDPDDIYAAWYRRPAEFHLPITDHAKELYLNREQRESQDLFMRAVSSDAWLNPLEKMMAIDHKLFQLREAERFGFVIPRTIVANNWNDIEKFMPDKVAFKMPYGELCVDNKLFVMSAKILKKEGKKFNVKGSPFPGIFQEFIEKKCEWRVTIVGDQVFSAAIFTHAKAKDDWRKHQRDDKLVEFREENFPGKLSKLCVDFLKKTGLKYGAFDFIEDHDGNIVFLEVNSNGQYGWLEDKLGLPISDAIAKELIAISKKNSVLA